MKNNFYDFNLHLPNVTNMLFFSDISLCNLLQLQSVLMGVKDKRYIQQVARYGQTDVHILFLLSSSLMALLEF